MLEPSDQPPTDDDGGDEGDATDPPPAKPKGGSGNVLAAAMLAVGEIFEPEKTDVEIVQTNDDPIDDLPFNIDFGDLPPLD